MECQTCNGLRFVSVKRQQFVTKNIQYTADGFPAWPNIGAYAVKERFPTGRMVGYLEPCEDCDATGLAVDPARNPDCYWCHGRGETHAYCSSGDWVPEVCGCENPLPSNDGNGVNPSLYKDLYSDPSYADAYDSDPSLSSNDSEKPAHPIEAELLARLEVS